MSITFNVSFFPSFPPGWDLAKSSGLKSLLSNKAIAKASPKAKAAVVLEVGARSRGQASLSTSVEILISVLLAIIDSVGPVKEKILQPIFFKGLMESIISLDSPEWEKIKANCYWSYR